MLFRRKSPCSQLTMPAAKEELERDKEIRLLDVRSPAEYRERHIPGSLNLPLDRLPEIDRLIPDKHTRLFVYCLSGGRSQAACAALAKRGYSNVANIGGITQWTGTLERTADI